MANIGWLLYVLLAALLIYFWSRRRGAFAELQALDAGQDLTKNPSPALPLKVGGRCEIGQTDAANPCSSCVQVVSAIKKHDNDEERA